MPAKVTHQHAQALSMLVGADDLVPRSFPFQVFRGDKEDVPAVENVLCEDNRTDLIKQVIIQLSTPDGIMVFHIFFVHSHRKARNTLLKYAVPDREIRGSCAILWWDLATRHYVDMAGEVMNRFAWFSVKEVAKGAEIIAANGDYPSGTLRIVNVVALEFNHEA
ncbi:hypothetical protein H1R20_g9459, partial [Candolleomyces eurysporus]